MTPISTHHRTTLRKGSPAARRVIIGVDAVATLHTCIRFAVGASYSSPASPTPNSNASSPLRFSCSQHVLFGGAGADVIVLVVWWGRSHTRATGLEPWGLLVDSSHWHITAGVASTRRADHQHDHASRRSMWTKLIGSRCARTGRCSRISTPWRSQAPDS